MVFSFGNCKCLHAGTWERRCAIYNGCHCTKYYHKRKDLGLIISGDMNVSEQCGIAASKGKIIGLIRP